MLMAMGAPTNSRAKSTKTRDIVVPSPHDWRTSDEDEINKRRIRAREESFTLPNRDPRQPVFSNFSVASQSGLVYSVEIRDVRQRQFACDCVDFRINGLGTCKHVEAVLLNLERRFKKLFNSAAQTGTCRIDVVLDRERDTLRVSPAVGGLPMEARRWFGEDGCLRNGSPETVVTRLRELSEDGSPELRISQEVQPWLDLRRRSDERKQLRRDYELRVQSGEWPANETRVPLFPYQREGMLHLAFAERALLADEMGLGKTIQAIAACALLQRLGQARRVLVVTPASLKTEWEDQIQRFTELSCQLVFGSRAARLGAYDRAGSGDAEGRPFFTLVNYEQMLADALDVNARLAPDIVVLDEAQRIKNWSAKTSQAVKRLQSRYAFVLTGTPIENRIDELHSLMDFLDPSVLGPLFRFNREFYRLDERGRPAGYCNLGRLHERVKPFLLRRRKADVETELPDRTDRNHFVPLSPVQKATYDDHESVVAKLASVAKRRPLTKQEQESMLRHLAMMRMVCDTNYILDPEDKTCPKLAELEQMLRDCRENDAKVIVFSEWERMLLLVRELCEELEMGYAWHTGSVPQRKRRAEIIAFKTDPQCRVFLSTDSGSTGLNLQNATVVINCDLPWTPAKLEQRIARAWRKLQSKPVTVINLVSENTIEHRMLETLAQKQALSDGILDRIGSLDSIQLRSGRQAFLSKLEQIITPRGTVRTPDGDQPAASLPADRALGFARRARERLQQALLRCEERYPRDGAHSVLYVVVDRNAAEWRGRLTDLHTQYFGPGRIDPLAPVHFEVVDRATDEALERLASAGLLSFTARVCRPLYPEPGPDAAPAPLSTEARAQLEAHRTHAARKLKMARVLGESGFSDEARPPLLEAIHSMGRALAIGSHMPEPASAHDAVLPPLSHAWGDGAPLLREFVAEAQGDWKSVIALVER